MENQRLVQLIDETCQGSTESYDRLIYCLENKVNIDGQPQTSYQEPKQLIDIFTFRAQKGNTHAMAFLGHIYLKGWSVELDLSKSLNYVRRSASLGNAMGEALLGFFYAQGLGGIVKDYDRALYWFKMALDKCNSVAANGLGVMYEEGWGVKKDMNIALKYYRQASEQKNVLAQKNLERLTKTTGVK